MPQGSSGRTTPKFIESGAFISQPTELKITLEPSTEDRDTTQVPTTLTASLRNGKASTSVTGGSRLLRKCSPSRLPTDLSIKYQTQVTRISCMNNILTSVLEDILSLSLTDVKTDLEQIEELHRDFATTHTYFELNWPAAFLDHEYFVDGLHRQEVKLYRLAKLALNKAKTALTAPVPAPLGQSSSSDSCTESKLPDIPLPKFKGEYSEWPTFREMFTRLILENERLSNIERLHHLRGCMEGAPAQLISNFPLVGTSLQPSWQSLVTRYENKRLLIQAQLDKLCSLTPLTSKSAKGLTALISAVSESRKVLESLGVTENLGDHLLVHHVSRNLDRSTLEAWETSLGSSSEYPQFQQLEAFVNSRARALESIESSTSSTQQSISRTRISRKPATAHRASTSNSSSQSQEQSTRNFHCDYCDSNHFIVVCPEFRTLDIAARRKVAVSNRLCFNCLGRHSANACRSTKDCKHCGARHHTMLHEAGHHGATEPLTSSTRRPKPICLPIHKASSRNVGFKRRRHPTKQTLSPPKIKSAKLTLV